MKQAILKVPDGGDVAVQIYSDVSQPFINRLIGHVAALPVLTRELFEAEKRVIHIGSSINSIAPALASYSMGYSEDSIFTAAGLYVPERFEQMAGLNRPGIIIPEYVSNSGRWIEQPDLQGLVIHETGHFLIDIFPDLILDQRFIKAHRNGARSAETSIRCAEKYPQIDIAPNILKSQIHVTFGQDEAFCNGLVQAWRGKPLTNSTAYNFSAVAALVAAMSIERGFSGDSETREKLKLLGRNDHVVLAFDEIMKEKQLPALFPSTYHQQLEQAIQRAENGPQPDIILPSITDNRTPHPPGKPKGFLFRIGVLR